MKGVRDVPDPTPVERLAGQLQHPTASSIWSRAVEVFGDEAKARSWMETPRDIFGGRSPQDLTATGDAAEQRLVLEILLRIDYGVFS
jgi:putative toxin-antitoxin system antitoxin component (TIGR02293 family)